MKLKHLGLLCVCAAVLTSCQKDGFSEIDPDLSDSLLSIFQNKKVIFNPIVDLSSPSNLNRSMRASGNIRDSVWKNNLGRTYFVKTSNMMVSAETYDVAYPGAIFNSKKIVDSYEFKPINQRSYDPLPIRASLSIPGPSVSGVIDFPGLGETRDFVGQVLGRQGNIEQLNTFSYTSSEFTDYNELKYTFGANVDVGKIVNASITGGGTKIKKKTGIIARFEQENFTVDMALPKKTELIGISDGDALMDEFAPSYISSVTYGRFGVFIAETDASYEDFNIAFKAGVNIGVVGVDTHVSVEQKALLDKAIITIYMKFGPAKVVPKTVHSYEEFKNAILEGANVHQYSYGGPISFRMRNLKYFSLFSTTFKIDVPN